MVWAPGGSNTLTLGGDLTTQNNNVIINAVGAERTLTLNESLIIGDGNDGTITFSGASKTLTIEDNATVNQDLTTDANVTFATLSVNNSGLKISDGSHDLIIATAADLTADKT